MCQEVRPERESTGPPCEGSGENLPSLRPGWLF